IMGYGVTSPRNSRSQTQQTHTGPLAGVLSTVLRYTVDTTGGNSGSPVIDETTGNPVGIHTHAGCTTSISNPRFNSGTRIDRSDLKSAIALTLSSRQPGQFILFGQGCPGSAGTPTIHRDMPAEIGKIFKFTVRGLPLAGMAIVNFGGSDKKWIGLTLPVPLPGGAGPSCKILISYDIMIPMNIFFGTLTVALPVPSDKSLVGAVFFNQAVVIDKIRNQTVLTSSNAARSVVGF
ncbi:MAG: trypsin-like serine peptidase, partial [Planctomycetota bacterium]